MNTRYAPTKWQQFGELILSSIGFGCRHRERTWPLKSWRGPAWARKFVVTQTCLQCGKKLEYFGPLKDNV